MIPPHGLLEIKETYGWIKIERDKQYGGWRIYDPIGWEATMMKTVHDLPGLPGRRLYIHKLIEAPLREALQKWQDTCGFYGVKSIACFCPRPKRNPATSDQMSCHSWGIALDINPSTNPATTIANPGDPFPYDMPNAFIDAFRSTGWTWGGDFKGLFKDGMHFQFASGF